jgi:uncharacterized RDD family membrane protein YckC
VTDAYSPAEFIPWGKRFAAWLVDIVMFWFGFLVFLLAWALVDGRVSLHDGEFILPILVFTFIWEVGWIAANSAKPGQSLVSMRVRSIDGSRVSVQQALIRWALHTVAFVLFFYHGIGLILALVSAVTIAATPRRQALHDLAAGTVAVTPEAMQRANTLGAPPPTPISASSMGATPAWLARFRPSAGRRSDQDEPRGPFL